MINSFTFVCCNISIVFRNIWVEGGLTIVFFHILFKHRVEIRVSTCEISKLQLRFKIIMNSTKSKLNQQKSIYTKFSEYFPHNTNKARILNILDSILVYKLLELVADSLPLIIELFRLTRWRLLLLMFISCPSFKGFCSKISSYAWSSWYSGLLFSSSFNTHSLLYQTLLKSQANSEFTM